jgi:hypothetical protein
LGKYFGRKLKFIAKNKKGEMLRPFKMAEKIRNFEAVYPYGFAINLQRRLRRLCLLRVYKQYTKKHLHSIPI